MKRSYRLDTRHISHSGGRTEEEAVRAQTFFKTGITLPQRSSDHWELYAHRSYPPFMAVRVMSVESRE